VDYANVIRDAWALTWRYRFLWVLGLFAGTTVGTCGGGGNPVQYRVGSEDLGFVAPAIGAGQLDPLAWLGANLGIILLIVVLGVLVILALIVVSLIAQGGMAQATADLARGQSTSLGQAWQAGRRLFWRYLGLWLILIAIAIGVAAIVGAVIAFAFAMGMIGAVDGPGIPVWVPIAALVGLLVALASIAVGILASILVAYAQRAIAVEDVDALAAIRSGWRLLRAHLGTSLLAWLLNVVLGIVVGIAIAFVVGAFVAALVAIGFISGAFGDLASPRILFLAGVALLIVPIILLLAGIANTFFWNYWTLIYLRLTGRLQAET
jgi:hypothetical protein